MLKLQPLSVHLDVLTASVSKIHPINEIAKEHDGGGHPLASGANSYSLEENEIIYQKLKNLLKNW